MMKKLLFPILLIAAATIAAIAAHLNERTQIRRISTDGSRTMLTDLQPSRAARIELRFGANAPLVIDRKGDNWIVHAQGCPDTFADPRNVADFLDSLANTRVLREIIPSKEDLNELALSDYQPKVKGSRSGFEVRITDPDGKTLVDMMLGIAHYKPAEMISDHYSMQSPDGRYVRITDPNGERHVFLIPRIFEKCLPFSGAWIEHLRLCSFSNPDLIRYTKSDPSGAKPQTVWEIVRKGAAYQLTVPAGKKLNGHKTDAVLKLLTGSFTRDIAPSRAVFASDSEITLQLINGFTYTLEMQSAPDEMKRYGRLHIVFDPAKVIRLQGESDAAFAERTGKLAQRAELEKQWFEGRIYVLQPDVIKYMSEIPGE